MMKKNKMKLIKMLDNENLINHYFFVEYLDIMYLREYNTDTKEIIWSITLNQPNIIKIKSFDIDEKLMESLFNKMYRAYKLERLIK